METLSKWKSDIWEFIIDYRKGGVVDWNKAYNTFDNFIEYFVMADNEEQGIHENKSGDFVDEEGNVQDWKELNIAYLQEHLEVVIKDWITENWEELANG